MISFCWYSLPSFNTSKLHSAQNKPCSETWAQTEPQLWYHFVEVKGRRYTAPITSGLQWTSRIGSTNSNMQRKYKHNRTHKWHKDLRGKPPQREEEKPRLWTNRSTQASLWSRVFSRTSRDYNTQFSSLPTGNNNNNHKRQDFSKAEYPRFCPLISKLLLNYKSKLHQIGRASCRERVCQYV